MAINYSSIKSDSFNESDLSVNSLTVNDDGVTHAEKLATVIIGSAVIKFTLSN